VILIVSAAYRDTDEGPAIAEYRERMQPLLLKYGAERVASARVMRTQPDDPVEFHITRFADKAEFDAMRADPDYLALEDLRREVTKDIRNYFAEEYVTFVD